MLDVIPTLRGRTAERARLTTVLAAARDGDGAAVILVGPIGIGKDAHHLDRLSASVVSYVARRLTGLAIGLIIATCSANEDIVDRAIPRPEVIHRAQ